MIEATPNPTGSEHLLLTACPACGASLDGQVWTHFLDEHGPEDFGIGGA